MSLDGTTERPATQREMAQMFGADDDATPVANPPSAPGKTLTVLPQQQPSNFRSDIEAKGNALQQSLIGSAQKAQTDQSIADRQRDENTKKDRERMDRAWGNENARADDPALDVWDADKEKARRTRGPMEQFGSVGFIFAMAASAFTRTPMTSALNAGAAAMTAIQQGDEKAYEHAYKAWKDNSELAIKRFDMEHRLYEDANKLLNTDMSLWNQKTLEIAAQFDHKQTIALLNAGMYPKVLEAQSAAARARIEVVQAQQKFEDFENERRMISEGIKAVRKPHPDWKDDNKGPEQLAAEAQVYARVKQAMRGQTQVREPTPDQQQYDLIKKKYENDPDKVRKIAKEFDEYKLGQHQPAGQAATAARAAKQVQAEQQRKAIVDDYATDIDTALERIQSMKKTGWGPQVGALAGATKLYQSATGGTEVADLQRNLAQLKEHYKEVFASKGHSLSAEFKELDSIIPGEIQGFNMSLTKGFTFPRFDRLQNVENALVDLRDRIKKRYSDLIKPEEAAESPPAPAGVQSLSTEELRQQLIDRGYDPDKL